MPDSNYNSIITRKPTLFFTGICALILFSGQYCFAEKYAGEQFNIPVGARAQALGASVIAGPFDGSAGFWNPAGMNQVQSRTLLAMHAETFGSLLNHDFAGYVTPIKDRSGFIKSFGLFAYYLGGDGILFTKIDGTSGRPVVASEESHADIAVGFSASGKLGSVDLGATARFLYSDIAVSTGWGVTLDIGALYRARSDLQLGLAIDNVTSGVIQYSDNRNESITPVIKPGLMYERRYQQFISRLLASADIRFEGRKLATQYWTGDMSLDTHYGLEIGYMDRIFARGGFDIGDLTLGAGLNAGPLTVDFAFLNHEELDNSYRVSLGWEFK